jgi:ABC-2 type transport system ATP-binding protein
LCDRVVVLDRGRVAAAGSLAELLGQRELRLTLDGVGEAAERRLAAAGRVSRDGASCTVALPAEAGPGGGPATRADRAADLVPDLVADLVGLGVRVHAVEPARISLEERLLSILRAGDGGQR